MKAEKQPAPKDDLDIHDVPEETTPETAVELRRPSVPITIDQLAMLPVQERNKVIEGRIETLTTYMRASIRGTFPEDWVLNRSPDGAVLAYLQDKGCKRPSMKMWGISVTPTSDARKLMQSDGSFIYVQTGDGFCSATGEQIIGVEGSRTSNDDNVRHLKSAELEMAVRKNCRANLDGRIIRNLAGLREVPIEMLADCWKDTNKSVEHCVKGHGFGTQAERRGAVLQEDSGIAESDKPKCGLCGKVMKYIPAGRTKEGKTYQSFFSCPSNQEHKKANEAREHYTVSASEWAKILEAKSQSHPSDEAEP